MSADDVVTLDDVEVVRRSDLGWYCTIQGRTLLVTVLQIAPGFLMPGEGRRGAIRLRGSALRDLDLPPQSTDNSAT